MYSSSEHLQQKKQNLSSSSSELYSGSVQRLAKSLSYDGKQSVNINPDIFNNNLRYLYFVNKPDNTTVYSKANKFPLLVYNGSGSSGFDSLLGNYSINRINELLNYLKDDDFENAFDNLGTSETQTILYGLYALKNEVGAFFHSLIDLYEKTFLSIKYFYLMYAEIKNSEDQCNKYKEDSIILNDMNKLKKYIEDAQKNIMTLTSISITGIKLNIKPEYQRYIELYGIPYKAVFDKVLLQDIIDEMYGKK
jgi:hypothetical protein